MHSSCDSGDFVLESQLKNKRVTREQSRRSRAKLRRRLQQSIKNARISHIHIKPPLTISRTVEMICQKGEEWRSSKSQLLFITGLGLTPVDSWRGMTPFTLPLVPDTFVLEDNSRKRCQSNRVYNLSEITSSDSGISEGSSVSNNSDAHDDNDCVCVGVVNFKTLPGYPSIKIAVTKG